MSTLAKPKISRRQLGSFCSWAGWFVSYLVANSKDWFSRDEVQIFLEVSLQTGTYASGAVIATFPALRALAMPLGTCPFKILALSLFLLWLSALRWNVIEPVHEIMALFVLRKTHSSNAHAQLSSGARCLMFGQTLRLLPYFMCANSDGSGETAWMRRLAWALACYL